MSLYNFLNKTFTLFAFIVNLFIIFKLTLCLRGHIPHLAELFKKLRLLFNYLFYFKIILLKIKIFCWSLHHLFSAIEVWSSSCWRRTWRKSWTLRTSLSISSFQKKFFNIFVSGKFNYSVIKIAYLSFVYLIFINIL